MALDIKAVAALNNKMDGSGYHVEIKALRYVRGWPERSTKPYQLYYRDAETENFAFVASFASLLALEANWRGRGAC